MIAGKAVCFKEALEPEFAEYQKQIIKKMHRHSSKGLMDRGVKIVSEGTDNHLMLIDLKRRRCDRQRTGKTSGCRTHHM